MARSSAGRVATGPCVQEVDLSCSNAALMGTWPRAASIFKPLE